jgi:hypothetical protein
MNDLAVGACLLQLEYQGRWVALERQVIVR